MYALYIDLVYEIFHVLAEKKEQKRDMDCAKIVRFFDVYTWATEKFFSTNTKFRHSINQINN